MSKKYVAILVCLVVLAGAFPQAVLSQSGNSKNVWPFEHIKPRFLPRVNVVGIDNNNDTEYAFLSAIPMSTFHYNGSVYQSLLIPDTFTMPVQYIMDDWESYLKPWGGVQHINFIGNIPYAKKLQVKDLYNISWNQTTNITGNPIKISNEIALHDWGHSSKAVIAPYKSHLTNDDIESISNAAVIASLYNAPLFFTMPDSMNETTIGILKQLGVSDVVLVEIGNSINQSVNNQLLANGIGINASLTTEDMVVLRIRSLTNHSMLCSILYNWQNLPAALYGAIYGGYVLFLPNSLKSLANSVGNSLQSLGFPHTKLIQLYELPEDVKYGEQQIANDFYNWLDSIGGNDPDKLEIVVTFNTATYYDPSHGFDVNFERALSGDPSNPTANGAVTGRMPLNFTGNIALVNRGGTYRATIFANPRPDHVTLCMNAYEVQHIVNAGSPVVDSWGTNHIVNEIFGWPYRGWCSENNYFPWQDIHNNTPDLSPILPPGPGNGPNCDPGVFSSFLGANYETHFHSGANAGSGSYPAQPGVDNIGFVADVANGSTFLYFSCHGGGTGIAVREYDNGIAQDYSGESWGAPYWPDDDGRTYDGSNGGYYTQSELNNDLGNTHGMMIGYNACDMANGEMNEILLEHGGIMSIGSYTSVSFTGSGWWWSVFSYLITHENYTLGEAATYTTARTSPLYAPNTGQKGVDTSLYYVCFGDPMVEYTKPSWNSPMPDEINILYGGHKPDGYTEEIIYNMTLYQGWNFVTIACENNYTASSLYNNISGCNLILKWNNSKDDFDVYTHGSPNNFVIENGTGYFISVNSNTNLSVTGMPIKSVNITLLVGWNSLGWFNPTQTNASDIYDNISGCNILLKWNNSRNDFDVYVPGAPDFVIEQGNGFFVSVSQQSQWHGV